MPELKMSRVEFLKVMLKSHCYDYSEQETSGLEFIDVDTNSWQAKIIAQAFSL
jgi:hypothetical protein